MNSRGQLRIDPGSIEADTRIGEVEVVVPYTDPSTTREVLRRAAELTAGLNARINLVAVHAVPFAAAAYGCPTAVHSFLVEQLVELSSRCPLPVDAQVVLARSRDEGIRHILKPESTIMVGSPKRFWRTSEEKLARGLAGDGHKVILLHIA